MLGLQSSHIISEHIHGHGWWEGGLESSSAPFLKVTQELEEFAPRLLVVPALTGTLHSVHYSNFPRPGLMH